MFKKAIIALGAIAIIVGGVIFYSCQKDNDDLTNAKIEKNNVLKNPFEKYGVLHNNCLKYILSQEDYAELGEAAWEVYGVPYFMEVLGDDYVATPNSVFESIFAQVKPIVENKKHLALLQYLIEEGVINPEFQSPNLKTRNNYSIFHDWFSYLENLTVTSSTDFSEYSQKMFEVEQEILLNYYSLLEDEAFNGNFEAKREYEAGMFCLAIARHSNSLWQNGIYQLDFYTMKRYNEADWVGSAAAFAMYDAYTATKIATECSRRAINKLR
jgi:hypothetical protein